MFLGLQPNMVMIENLYIQSDKNETQTQYSKKSILNNATLDIFYNFVTNPQRGVI